MNGRSFDLNNLPRTVKIMQQIEHIFSKYMQA